MWSPTSPSDFLCSVSTLCLSSSCLVDQEFLLKQFQVTPGILLLSFSLHHHDIHEYPWATKKHPCAAMGIVHKGADVYSCNVVCQVVVGCWLVLVVVYKVPSPGEWLIPNLPKWAIVVFLFWWPILSCGDSLACWTRLGLGCLLHRANLSGSMSSGVLGTGGCITSWSTYFPMDCIKGVCHS